MVGETFKHYGAEYRVIGDLRPAHDTVIVERTDLHTPDGGPIRSHYQAALAGRLIVQTRESE